MLTSSHLFWAAHLRDGADRWWLLGAVAPDLPAIAVVVALRATGHSARYAFCRTYRRSPSRELQLAAHSILTPLVLAGLGRRSLRGLAAGWLGHLAVDALTHHDDAWPPLWPISRWRWASPVSYWQPEHHARWVQTAEIAGMALAARRTRHRGLLIVAAAVTAQALRRSWDFQRA